MIRRQGGTTSRQWGRQQEEEEKGNNDDNGATCQVQEMMLEMGDFDIRTSWKEVQEQAQDFWKDLVDDYDDDGKSPKVTLSSLSSSSQKTETTTDENGNSAIPLWMSVLAAKTYYKTIFAINCKIPTFRLKWLE